MKILILHHVQERWDSAIRNHAGTNFEAMCEKIIEYIDQENRNDAPYDKIILSNFESHEIEDAQGRELLSVLPAYRFDVEQFDYNWNIEGFDAGDDMKDYIFSGGHSQLIYKYEWVQNLDETRNEIYLAGAFDGECIQDIERLMDFYEMDYERVNELII